MRWLFFARRPLLAARLVVVATAYLCVAFLALTIESERAKRVWAAMTVPGIVLLLLVGSLSRWYEGHQGPFVAQPGEPNGVRMSFVVDRVPGEVTTAQLVFGAEVRGVTQRFGSEAIWLEGIVSGGDAAVDPRFVREDLRPTNDLFGRALDVCCRERKGALPIDLSRLLRGSSVTATDLLRDGRLDLALGTHTTVDAAALYVCWNEPTPGEPVLGPELCLVAKPLR
ncbi:MAG: hypothetical protein RMA76_13420 [Deltaproteobacteria bacterium]|jgi:hypothetical protein